MSDKDFEVKVSQSLIISGQLQRCILQKGDRIAQLILEEICMADIEEVEDLDATERGHGGFGSTGVGKQAAVTKTEESENSQRQPKAMKLK